jgi:hypothetical protein
MSAGYIQLAALGQQDVYLTGEPQVTYFSGIYKRHTPFVLEAYDIPFNDQYITFGGTSICHIPPKGDLIRGLTLKMTLPPLYNAGQDWTWSTPPGPTNVPQLWFGLIDRSTGVGSITQVTGSSFVPYYSTNQYISWAFPFFPGYGSYNSRTNQFIFTYSAGSLALANVIVQSSYSSNNAGSSIFWGLDPLGYSYIDTYGNLVYTATSNTVTPAYTLQQAGWVQTSGFAVNTLSSLHVSLINPYPTGTPGVNLLNLNQTTAGVQSYYNYDSTGSYSISVAGCVIFNTTGYFLVRAGFNIDACSVQSLSYVVLPSDYNGTIPSIFAYTSTCTVSPTPSSPVVIPINVTTSGQYYAFFVTTSGSGNFTQGTYLSITPVNDLYQFTSNISVTSGSKVPLYGNTTPQNNPLTLNQTSNINFSINGEYLVTGLLSVANAVTSNTTEVYVSNVTFGNLTSSYTYDMSQQGRNPTYAFSIPVVASNTANYWVSVSTQSKTSNLLTNSFLAINQVGVKNNDVVPGIILPYNGVLLQSTSNTLSSPLNLKTNFSLNGNTSAWVTVNTQGNLVFQNVASYMLTGVFYTTNTVTNVIITNSSSNFLQYYNPTLGYSDSAPYTISVPFHISDNTASYGITLQMSTPTGTVTTVGNVLSNTYIAVYPLASNIFSGSFGQIYNYYDGVATLAVTKADLKIGGQTIQSITGEYIEVWNELNVPYENQPGLQLLTGKYDTQTSIGAPRTYYVNLPYYFYGNPELSLPITSLGRQDVEVWVTFNNFSNLTSVSVTNPTLSATIITEYAYLSNPEIDWFQNHRLDYIITQCQYDLFQLPQNFQTAIFDLKFKNPIKELFFLIHPNSNLPYNYTTPGGGTETVTFGMTFNGADAFLTSTTNSLYTGSIEPFNKHINFFSRPNQITIQQPNQYGRQFYMYSFSTNPFATLSSGQINFSRIRQVLLELNIKNSLNNYPTKTFNVIALSQNVLRIENGIAGIMFQ